MIMLNNPKTIGYVNPFAGSNNDKSFLKDVPSKIGVVKYDNEGIIKNKAMQDVLAQNAKEAYRKFKSAAVKIDYKA